LGIKELRKLLKQEVSSHQKGGFEAGKMRLERLGTKAGLSLLFKPSGTPGWTLFKKRKPGQSGSIMTAVFATFYLGVI